MTAPDATRRVRIEISGIVQGVGFRPFLHRLAAREHLTGWARNTPAGVELELEGPAAALDRFVETVRTAPPPLAVVEDLTVQPLAGRGGYGGFAILPSTAGAAATLAAPDLAPCPACLRELAAPADRRYRYPFINCTDCGPRFSILRALPYDRANTSMAGFPMCPACAAEYGDIRTRRYHAQPDCCPACGPQAFYLDAGGREQPGDPIAAAQRTLAAGGIVAVKGAGGIHLACDALDPDAVARLRRRKHRPEKPLAVLCRDLAAARRLCCISDEEAALLQSPRRPILLLEKRRPGTLGCLSQNRRLGLLLPYTPLHVLLADGRFGGPAALVLTSANRPGCPVLTENDAALDALRGVADGWLLHDRPIVNRCDDSVAAVWRGREYFYRRSRGYAPQPLTMPGPGADGVLAFGAEQKAGFAAGKGRHVFLSQHIGDLKNAETLDHYRTALDAQTRLFGLAPRVLACDLHPDYSSTREAETLAAARRLPLVRVQHHWAHMAACMADNRLEGPAFGIVWDGTGLGTDGAIWGGEFLRGGYDAFVRVGSIRPIPLPGGDAAVRQIGRTGLALALDAGLGAEACAALLPGLPNAPALRAMLEKGIACPQASSIGRLFDGVYALLTGRIDAGYDGQAPALLEALAGPQAPGRDYPLAWQQADGLRRFDYRPLVAALCADRAAGVPPAAIARGFMDALCRMALDQCRALNAERLPVVLSGGVFLNQYLLHGVTRLLEADGFAVYTHRRVSPSDEGLALGQLAVAAAARRS
ncbi:MAG: carbamoyltransferase HypF [Blautia massiliensis (ex Durand et al. 2017)]